MPRISQYIAKLEDRLSRQLERMGGKKLKTYALLGGVGWYFYGMILNSIILGIAQTFPKPGTMPVENIWIVNPIRNLLAVFTPTGIGVTLVAALLICLITKKGYNWFSGYHFKKDPRGFDILPDATHGTSSWMDRKAMETVLTIGTAAELEGVVLGKHKAHKDDGDKYAEYVAPAPDNHLNRHILVYGASGSGKSRGFVKPFILQAAKRRESMLIVDPKAELFEFSSAYLREQGYEVRCYNLLDLENSDGFNCLTDVQDDPTLIQTITEVIMKNTSNQNERQDFWEKAESNLLMALLHYVQRQTDPDTGELLPVERRSLGAVYEILSTNSFQEIEEIFAQLPKSHPAMAPYGIFRLANRQILGNIAIGLGNRLSVFQNKLVDVITRHDDIDLVLPGQKPCAYFCIISASDSSLEFLSSLFFSLSFTKLMNFARRNYANASLPVPVNILLEEACNVGYLADFKRTISVCRSYNIHCQVVVQGIAQLSDRYQNHEWEEIIGNCDTQIFLGCNDQMTAKYISDKCGMVTIRTTTSQIPMQPLFSPIYNTTKPYSQGRSNAQRPLMYPDELLRLDNAQEIVLFRGQNPLMLYKIIPDELPVFSRLKPVRVVDYIPEWREQEKVNAKQAAKTEKAPPPESVSFVTQLCDQPSLFDAAPAQEEYPRPMREDVSPPATAAFDGEPPPKLPGNLQQLVYANVYKNVPPESLKESST